MPRRSQTAKAPAKPPARRGRRSREELEALRYAARCTFTLEHQAISLEDLARRPAFRGVGLAKIAAWAQEEDWLAERRATIGAWRRRAEAAMGRHLQREGRHQRDMLQSLHDQAVALRCQQVVQPKSWEQVANVQLKTASLLRQWHREDLELAARLSQPGTPAAGPQQLPDKAKQNLSQEEAHRAAHFVLETRLGERPAAAGPADGDATLEEAPIAAPEEVPPAHVASA